MPLESKFQTELIKEIKQKYPGAVILKNDPNYLLGVPDWLVLYEDRWAMLEAKASKNAEHQPNQDYWIKKLFYMSYASFVYPENKEQVLYELQKSFGISGSTRFSRCK